MIKRPIFILIALTLLSCKDSMQSKNHGAIVLGDSSTIVTEKDKSRLQDLVSDLHPKEEEPPHDTVVKDKPVVKTDTAKATPQQSSVLPAQPLLPPVAGMKADFKETSILLPNVNAKQSGNPNLSGANGAVYTLVSGMINGNVLHTTGNVLKVSQRYQSIVVVKNRSGILPVDALTLTTPWQTVQGGNGSYPLTGLDEDNLEFSKANTGTIKNDVAKAAQKRRMNRKKVEEWVSSVSNVRAANQKPLTVMLRSVMWKIDGKDASGKPFSKQIRIDIPM